MMKVWLGYECIYNGCDQWEVPVKAFDCEEKALVWQEEKDQTEWEWRSYAVMEVE